MKKTKKEKPYRSLLSNFLWASKMQLKYAPLGFFIRIFGIPVEVALNYCSIYLPSLIVKQAISGNAFYDIVLAIGSFFIIQMLLSQIKEGFMIRYTGAEDTKFNFSILYLINERSFTRTYEEYEKKETRDLCQRAKNTCFYDNGAADFSIRVTFMLQYILSYVLFGGIIASFSPWMLPIIMVEPILSLICTRAYQKWVHKHREYESNLSSKLGYAEELPDDFAAGKDIRVYGMSGWLSNIYYGIVKEMNGWERKKASKSFLSSLSSLVVILLRDSLAYAFLIGMAINKQITVDEFVLYFAAISQFASFFGGILNTWGGLHASSLRVCDVRKYIDTDATEAYGDEKADEHILYAPEIEFNNVSYRYDGSDDYVLKNISVKFKAGESLALVGLNGAGKTTLVKLLCGLYKPTSGQILINGVPSDSFALKEYYRLFSPVFQDSKTAFFTIAETVSGDLKGNYNASRVEDCLRRAGLGKKLDSLPKGIHTVLDKQVDSEGTAFSGGETQKLMMARALYKDAPILVLDEPTAALDPIAESKIYEEYRSMTKGKTSLFISHRLASTRFCDRVVYMENGEITEIGTHEELLSLGGEYSRLYEMQSCWYRDDYGKEENV
ncbi:MAG: ABC transporter ATP-binding protein [Clostridia bacterium]|nr:ABC transporter ATP-binding protein [Clostridia bacterium]